MIDILPSKGKLKVVSNLISWVTGIDLKLEPKMFGHPMDFHGCGYDEELDEAIEAYQEGKEYTGSPLSEENRILTILAEMMKEDSKDHTNGEVDFFIDEMIPEGSALNELLNADILFGRACDTAGKITYDDVHSAWKAAVELEDPIVAESLYFLEHGVDNTSADDAQQAYNEYREYLEEIEMI